MSDASSADNNTAPLAHCWQIKRSHALIGSGACWLVFVLVAWGIHSGALTGFDAAGLRYWRENGPASLEMHEAVRDITALGGVTQRVLFTLGVIVALLFMRLKRDAVLLVAALLSGLAINSAIKVLAGRPRPQIVPHLTEAGGMSFPSGHSFNSALGMIAVALVFAALSSRPSVRRTIIGTAIVASVAVAWSRVWLGVHYPSDVIAGWFGGAGWALLFAALLFSRPALTRPTARQAKILV